MRSGLYIWFNISLLSICYKGVVFLKIKGNKVSYKEQQKNGTLTKYIENKPIKEEKGSKVPKKEKSG